MRCRVLARVYGSYGGTRRTANLRGGRVRRLRRLRPARGGRPPRCARSIGTQNACPNFPANDPPRIGYTRIISLVTSEAVLIARLEHSRDISNKYAASLCSGSCPVNGIVAANCRFANVYCAPPLSHWKRAAETLAARLGRAAQRVARLGSDRLSKKRIYCVLAVLTLATLGMGVSAAGETTHGSCAGSLRG